MPYQRAILFNPSPKFKNTWSLVPQNQVLEIDGIKTNSMYGDVSAAIPIFYLLTLLATGFDIYLGVSVLAKSGVNLPVVIISVILDIFLAIVVYLFALKNKNYNLTYLDNEKFKAKLEMITMKKGENPEEYKQRKLNLDETLDKIKRKIRWVKFLKWFFSLLIILIAGWKIYTFMSVLPPNLSIFTLVKGKIVIILATLTAVFHIIATEKTAASLWFNHIKNKELKKHRQMYGKSNTTLARPMESPVDFIGKYKPVENGNTKLVFDEEKDEIKLEYYFVIWDDEIKYLMNTQTNDSAKRGVVIACKQTQL